MNSALRTARLERKWSQEKVATRLGVSQAYLSMLEAGRRPMSQSIARKAVSVFEQPTLMPLPTELRAHMKADPQGLAETLAAWGYRGFAYLKTRPKKTNPADVLMTALAQDELESRLVEALPWLLLKFWNLDSGWLVFQAKLHDLQNRLGFVTTLARKVSERSVDEASTRTAVLRSLEQVLERSKLAHEGTLCRILSPRERSWLAENRTEDARNWNLLTDLSEEHLNHVR